MNVCIPGFGCCIGDVQSVMVELPAPESLSSHPSFVRHTRVRVGFCLRTMSGRYRRYFNKHTQVYVGDAGNKQLEIQSLV